MPTITLAHPLGPDHCQRLGLEPVDHNTNDEIDVPPEVAKTLISAGYAAGIHPDDTDAIAALLNPAAAEQPAEQVQTAGAGEAPAPATDPNQRKNQPSPVLVEPGTAQGGVAPPPAGR